MQEKFSTKHGFELREPEIKVTYEAPRDLRGVAVDIAYEAGMNPHSMRDVVCNTLRVRKNEDNWSAYPNVNGEVRDNIDSCEWYEVYDVIEAVYQYLLLNAGDGASRPDLFAAELNKYLKKHGIGWQLVDGEVRARGDRLPESQGTEIHQTREASVKPTHALPAEPHEEFEVFISHASEDKESIARPLYQVLVAKGCKVWFDEAVLQLGDGLNQKISEGLNRCRYGVVILSPNFFQKVWPQKELDGLVARETSSGNKSILPIWHNIDFHGVAAYSPMLADRIAARTSEGIEAVAEKILAALGKESSIPANTPSSGHLTVRLEPIQLGVGDYDDTKSRRS